MIVYIIIALVVVIVLIKLANFQKPGTLGAKILGLLYLLISMVGIFFLVSESMVVIITIILTATGDDATGLGIVVGPLIGTAGLVLCAPILSAIRLLNLKRKHVVYLVILVAGFAIAFGIKVTFFN